MVFTLKAFFACLHFASAFQINIYMNFCFLVLLNGKLLIPLNQLWTIHKWCHKNLNQSWPPLSPLPFLNGCLLTPWDLASLKGIPPSTYLCDVICERSLKWWSCFYQRNFFSLWGLFRFFFENFSFIDFVDSLFCLPTKQGKFSSLRSPRGYHSFLDLEKNWKFLEFLKFLWK